MPQNFNPQMRIDGLAVGFGGRIIQQELCFTIKPGSIFAIMGGSGCGKSTLLKTLIGLLPPIAGSLHVGDIDYWGGSSEQRAQIARGFGVLFQSGALWSAMTVAQNVALPLQMLTALDAPSIDSLVTCKLGLVGLAHAADMMPADLSGGMRKRAGLARALALDPGILFFDEPSAGLDPILSRRLDDLISQLRDGFGCTVVIVSHELPSLLAICDDGIFLDSESKTAIAHGSPKSLLEHCDHPLVHAFMRRETTPEEAPVGN